MWDSQAGVRPPHAGSPVGASSGGLRLPAEPVHVGVALSRHIGLRRWSVSPSSAQEGTAIGLLHLRCRGLSGLSHCLGVASELKSPHRIAAGHGKELLRHRSPNRHAAADLVLPALLLSAASRAVMLHAGRLLLPHYR
jgi:hypothetical protein